MAKGNYWRNRQRSSKEAGRGSGSKSSRNNVRKEAQDHEGSVDKIDDSMNKREDSYRNLMNDKRGESYRERQREKDRQRNRQRAEQERNRSRERESSRDELSRGRSDKRSSSLSTRSRENSPHRGEYQNNRSPQNNDRFPRSNGNKRHQLKHTRSRSRSRSPLPPPPTEDSSISSNWAKKPARNSNMHHQEENRKHQKLNNRDKHTVRSGFQESSHRDIESTKKNNEKSDFARRLSINSEQKQGKQQRLPHEREKIQIPLGPASHKKRKISENEKPKYNNKHTGSLPPWKTSKRVVAEKKTIQPIASRTSSVYERILQVGEGTYGKVYKSRNVDTGIMAALKRLRMESERDGMPITAIREIKLLQSLRHKNIVSLREMMVEEGNIYMTLEYMDHDLAGILSHPNLHLGDSQIKFLMLQMLNGLAYIHHKGILHRDIKGSNILLDTRGNLKLADFGLARTIDLSNSNAHYTNRVITLWYRPPELLLGATIYSTEIDIWGIGCLLVEMYTKTAIFAGQDEISQLQAIYDIMGTPTSEVWPSVHQLPWYPLLRPKEAKANCFKNKYSALIRASGALDLAIELLTMDPKGRISAKQALNHSYFTDNPLPTQLDLSNIGEWHEFEAKRRRRKYRENHKLEQSAIVQQNTVTQ